jgi:hypothetical protein
VVPLEALPEAEGVAEEAVAVEVRIIFSLTSVSFNLTFGALFPMAVCYFSFIVKHLLWLLICTVVFFYYALLETALIYTSNKYSTSLVVWDMEFFNPSFINYP